jgi:hypothetical protein
MEVVETFEHGALFAAVLRGHPDDLPFTDGAGARGAWVVVRVKGKLYYLVKATADVLEAARTGVHLQDVLDGSSLFLRRTLAPGKTLMDQDGEPTGWVVDSAGRTEVHVPGAPVGKRRSYRLVQQFLADHTVVTYVADIGLTHYEYSHHGSLSDVELDLVEVHVGPAQP